MTLKEVVEKLGLSALTQELANDTEISGAYTCDLLSDVMANGKPGNLWITMQTHQNILAVVRLKDLAGIIVVNGRQPDGDTIEKAADEKVSILGTGESAFSISGRLYRLLEES